MLIKPQIKGWFDPISQTISYAVYQDIGTACAIIDTVLGYNPNSKQINTQLADDIIDFINTHHLTVKWILETHHHADHVTAASYLKSKLGGTIAINHHITAAEKLFPHNSDPVIKPFSINESAFDYLFQDDEVFQIGTLTAQALYVPGHTLTCVAYLIGNAIFVGDTLFMPDVGTGRCDFPGGNAHSLYQSIQKIFSLPEQTRLFVCHDYPPSQRNPAWETNIAIQRTQNIHIKMNTSEEAFVEMRMRRDLTLAPPKLLLPAIQLNLRAGRI